MRAAARPPCAPAAPAARRGRRSRCPAATATGRWHPTPAAARRRRSPRRLRRRSTAVRMAGSITAPATDAPSLHGRHGDRVPGQAVEEVDGAVDRVDHPRRAASAPPSPPCSSPTTASPGRSTASRSRIERLHRVVRCGDDVGGRALRGHAAHRPVCAVRRVGVPWPRQAAQVLGSLGDDALGDPAQPVRIVARAAGGGLFGVSGCARTGLVHGDHPTTRRRDPDRRRRRLGAPRRERLEHTQLQWPSTPTRDGLRQHHRTAIRRGIRQHLDLQPDHPTRPGAPQSAP